MAQPTDQTHASGDFDDAIDRLRADYDTTPYTSNSFPQSAPGHLAAVAHVFGLETPEVPSARVLEIGCSAGGNVIPFAAWHPQARVVGIDLSQVQIDQGVPARPGVGPWQFGAAAGRYRKYGPSTRWGNSISSSATACTAGCPKTSSRRSCLRSAGCWPSEGRGFHQLQRVSGLEGQGDRAGRDAAARRRQGNPGREAGLRPRHDRLLGGGGPGRQRIGKGAGRFQS